MFVPHRPGPQVVPGANSCGITFPPQPVGIARRRESVTRSKYGISLVSAIKKKQVKQVERLQQDVGKSRTTESQASSGRRREALPRTRPRSVGSAIEWLLVFVVPLAFWFALRIDTNVENQWLANDPIHPAHEMPGVQVYSQDFRTHLPEGVPSPYAYDSSPPTSGPHWEDVRVPVRVLSTPLPIEIQLHELEHSSILMQYRCDTPCPHLVDQLTAIARAHHEVIVAPNPDLPAPLVLTVWRRMLTLDGFDARHVDEFVATYGFAGRRHTPLAPVWNLLQLLKARVGLRPDWPVPGPLDGPAPTQPVGAVPTTWSFDDLKPGTLPPGWHTAGRDRTDTGMGWWRVTPQQDTPSSGNALHLRSVTDNDHFLLLPVPYRDFTFQARILWQPTDQATEQFSIAFRGSDLLNNYRLRVYQRALPSFPVVYLARVEAARPHTLYEAGLDQIHLLPNLWYGVGLTVSGSTIRVTINDQRQQQLLSFSAQDQALAAAPTTTFAIAGFANSNLWVDDVKVEPSK